MRSKSDMIARLAALRTRGLQTPTENSSSALREITEFGANPGSLRSFAHIPATLPEKAPLIVVLHGCTQTAAGYDHGAGWSKLADEQGFAVLYPEQQRSNNANLCFNWFSPSDVRRDAGEVMSIRSMIEKIAVTHGIDRKRIFITGLSAGGGMASSMLATYPEVFAGGAIIAGLAHGIAGNIPEAFDRMRGHGIPNEKALDHLLRSASQHSGSWPKISVWQGSTDATVAPGNADAIVAQWRGVHGVAAKPTRTDRLSGQTRHVWCDASGAARIESITIAGMGHGTPLATAGADSLGHAGQFMLEAGISSTRHIANFWGLSDVKPAAAPKPAEKDVANAITVEAEEKPQPRRMRPTAGAAPKRPEPVVSGIAKTIEDALRRAGLLS